MLARVWQYARTATFVVVTTMTAGYQQLQSQRIRGAVTADGDGGRPVVAAEVSVLGGRARTRTDERGRFQLDAQVGDSLRVRALGYRERRLVARDDLQISLQQLPTLLDGVITTVGQREIRAADSPASITVLTRADILAANAVSANQLLRRIPGLQEIASPPAQTSIAIRGLDQARVLVLVDGEPVAGAMMENRDIGRLSTLAAERIEVVKGPSSVEYGSEALGGVINLVTAAPTSRLTVQGDLRSGELGRRESSLELSDTFGPVGLRLSGGWRQVDRVTALTSSSTTLDRVYDFRADSRVRINDRVTLRTDLNLSQQRQRWPTGGGFNAFIDNNSTQGFVETQVKVAGGLLRARAFGQRYAYQFRIAPGLLPIAGSADSLQQNEQLARGLLSFNRRIGAHSVDIGGQFSARGIVAPDKVDGDSVNDRISEFFVRDAWTMGDVLLTAGARTTTSSLWGNAISPSVGAVWQAGSAWRVRGNIARGFRGPSFKELRYTFINAGGGYQVVGNPLLRPESSWSTSVGATWAPMTGVALELEGYRNALSNLITTQTTGTNTAGLLIFQNVNVARARTEGIETGVRVTRTSREIIIGYDFLRARDLLTGATLDGRAQHTARVALSQQWKILAGAISDMSARYTGSAPRGTSKQAKFLSLDGQLRLRVRGTKEVSLGVTNLLDQRPNGWAAAFQRQFTVGLRAGWGTTAP